MLEFARQLSILFKTYNLALPDKLIVGCKDWNKLSDASDGRVRYWVKDNTVGPNQLQLFGVLFEKRACDCELCPHGTGSK